MSTALPTASPAYGPDRPSAVATVDNATPQGSTYRRENSVQTNGASSTGEYLQTLVIRSKRLIVIEWRITRIKRDAVQMVEHDWSGIHET
jgi:hypothetical protein